MDDALLHKPFPLPAPCPRRLFGRRDVAFNNVSIKASFLIEQAPMEFLQLRGDFYKYQQWSGI
jgi:hypothetical protein